MRQFVLRKKKESSPLQLIDQLGEPRSRKETARKRGSERAGREAAPARPAAPPAAASTVAPSTAAPSAGAPSAAASASPAPSQRPRKRGERCYVVSYDGQYIGFFEADDVLTPCEAFTYVARELAARGPFDPEKLALHKPVLIRSARPPKGTTFVRGRLARVEGLESAAPAPAAVPPPVAPPPAAPVTVSSSPAAAGATGATAASAEGEETDGSVIVVVDSASASSGT